MWRKRIIDCEEANKVRGQSGGWLTFNLYSSGGIKEFQFEFRMELFKLTIDEFDDLYRQSTTSL